MVPEDPQGPMSSAAQSLGSHSRLYLSSGLWPHLGPPGHPRSAESGPS